jgi:hypothetical protein
MKVNELITTVDSEYANPYDMQNKLNWINELELRYRLEVDQKLGIFELSRLSNIAGYDMPSGVQFKDLKIVYIDRRKADFIDLTSYQKPGYYQDADGKFAIYPVPIVSDSTPGIRCVYIIRPTAKVLANIETDDLLITDEYINVYKYFIFWKIALMNREFDEANNWSDLFNSEFAELSKWVKRKSPAQAPELSRTRNVM